MNLLVGHRARLNATIARKEALLYYQIVAVVAFDAGRNRELLPVRNFELLGVVGGAAQLYVMFPWLLGVLKSIPMCCVRRPTGDRQSALICSMSRAVW
jgi:hypothetical protein